MPSDQRRVARALLSVSDKAGLVSFASGLAAAGVVLVSTGGTHRILTEAGLAVTEVADLTGFPEMMDGRLKTLHPKVHGGLLAVRENPEHEAAMLAHSIEPIDLLVVNLYPFEATVARGDGEADAVEMIDIGGPAMVRGAAKNHADVAVVVDPADYESVLAAVADGGTTFALRRRLAAKAFARTAAYDAAIANWMAGPVPWAEAPGWHALGGRLVQELRYGENPHQAAAFYVGGSSGGPARPGVATARQVGGKPLSFNNLADADGAIELIAEFTGRPAVAIIKHANPCGVAEADTLVEAYGKALRCDPQSAFGGIVALNRRLDAAAARAIVAIFTEVIVAPDADAEAIAIVAAKPNLRLLLTGALPDPAAPGTVIRPVAGGFLAQARDSLVVGALDVVTRRAPSDAELADLVFAFTVAKHVRSNAIVFARNGATVGIGAGQMSRVDASRMAAWKAQDAARAAGEAHSLANGSVVASDAFFPFADGLAAAAAAGATAVIQPGGSLRDAEVIAAADAAGLAMVLTGVRHFRH